MKYIISTVYFNDLTGLCETYTYCLNSDNSSENIKKDLINRIITFFKDNNNSSGFTFPLEDIYIDPNHFKSRNFEIYSLDSYFEILNNRHKEKMFYK